MEPLEASLRSIESIEKDIKGSTVTSPPELIQKLQAFADSLKLVAESGRGMNDVDLFPVPAELLQFLDAPTSTANPEIFRAQTYKKARLGVEAIASRIEYLKTVGSLGEEKLNATTSEIHSSENTSTKRKKK